MEDEAFVPVEPCAVDEQTSMAVLTSEGPLFRQVDLSGFNTDPDRFYDVSYSPTIRAMVDAVREAEAPVRDDVLANASRGYALTPIDGALDLEQGIEPPHDLDRDRGERDFPFAGGPATRILFDVGHGEEPTPCMRPARGFPDRSRMAPGQIDTQLADLGTSAPGSSTGDAARRRTAWPSP